MADQWVRLAHHPPEVADVLIACAWARWVPMVAQGTTTRAGQTWRRHLTGPLGPAIDASATRPALGRSARRHFGHRGWKRHGAGPARLELAHDRGSPQVRGGDDLLVVIIVLVLALNGFCEETGWRGSPGRPLGIRPEPVGHVLARHRRVGAIALPLFRLSERIPCFGPTGAAGWEVSIAAGSVVLIAPPASEALAAPALSAAVIAVAVVLIRRSCSRTAPSAAHRPGGQILRHRGGQEAVRR